MRLYDMICDISMTVIPRVSYDAIATVNGKLVYYEYKTAKTTKKENPFVFKVPGDSNRGIVYTTTPYTDTVDFSIGDLRPSGQLISKIATMSPPKTQFCHCAITSLMRGGCSCGGS